MLIIVGICCFNRFFFPPRNNQGELAKSFLIQFIMNMEARLFRVQANGLFTSIYLMAVCPHFDYDIKEDGK